MEENKDLLQEDSLVADQEPKSTTGYKKRIEISEDKKRTEGVSVWTIIGKALMYIFLAIFALWTLFPLFIGLFGSFITKHDANLAFTGRNIFPITKTKISMFQSYREVFFGVSSKTDPIELFHEKKFPLIPFSFVFTILLVIPPTILGLFTSAMSAFAFSKLNFKGKNWMFGLLLSTMMIPGALSLAPAFSIYREVLPIDTLWTAFPLFIPGMLGAATCVFFLKQYFSGIPTDLIEAGKLDGMGYYSMFFKIIVPLSSSALIAQGILGFVGGYNDYFGPLLYLKNSGGFKTVQLALTSVQTRYGGQQDYNVIFAACFVALLPTLVLYFFAQRFFVEGIATSGMKI